MFNNLNIPNSLLKDITGILSETRKNDLGIPEFMVEYANKAATRFPAARTLEDQRDIVAEEFHAAIKTQPGLEPNVDMVVKFDNAVKFILKNSGKAI